MLFSLVTYSGLPHLDPDDQLIARALEERGFSCQPLVWNDPTVDWNNAGVCIVRSTWDYHKDPAGFSSWIDRLSCAAVVLLNPPSLLRWNINKGYLLDLQERGVRIVPTLLCPRGAQIGLKRMLDETNWESVIIKPAIGLATAGVKKFEIADLENATQHLQSLLSDGDALVQPYLANVETVGEKALVFIGGQFSHAVKKTAFQPLAVAGEAGERLTQASAQEIEFGQEVLRTLSEEPLYARIDIVHDESNKPNLLELELIEPSLFLSISPAAADQFAEKLLARPELVGKANESSTASRC